MESVVDPFCRLLNLGCGVGHLFGCLIRLIPDLVQCIGWLFGINVERLVYAFTGLLDFPPGVFRLLRELLCALFESCIVQLGVKP